jgi:RecA/RadA recombinase
MLNKSLMDRIQKAGSILDSSILADSPYFNERDVIPTELPILNVAFSGRLDGGLVPGLTIFAGLSKSYKTLLALWCMRAYLQKYPDAIALIFDSEFSITPEYLAMHTIDPTRVLHIPVQHLEQLKFDMVKRLDEIKRGDRVFILVDSIGTLSSKKEVEDAMDEKSVSDMTRAKSIRSLLRIITPHLTTKDIPAVIINHVYQTMELYAKTVVGGGTAIMYNANQVFIISKAQEKDSEGTLLGSNFTINIEKSRFVKERSKLVFQVLFDKGIQRWSGLFDLALEAGIISSEKKGWYQIEGVEKGVRRADIEQNESFWEGLIENEKFNDFVKRKYQLTGILTTPVE